MSLLWLYFLANIMIDILNVIIVVTDVDESYIGLTFLSVGNTVSGILNGK